MAEEIVFDIAELAATLPQTSDTMLRDLRLVDREAASCRIFRTYRTVPPHFHVSCDEYLYVLQGRALFQIAAEEPREVGPGMLIHFPKRTVHGMPALLEEPFVVLAIDTPRRTPEDVTFVDPSAGDAASFIATEDTPTHGDAGASPSLSLVRLASQQTLEGMRLRRELVHQRRLLVAREQHLGELRAQLVSFEGRYLRQVGLLHRQLDGWEEKIAELHGQTREAEGAVESADDEEGAVAEDPLLLRDLYRDLAKLLHPDFAIDAPDEQRRTRLMALANDAYRREDAHAIRRMLIGYGADDGSGHTGHLRDEDAHLAAVLRQVAQEIAAVDLQIEELQRSDSAQLQAKVLDAAREGRDLLAEMAARVKGSIGLAMRRYELDLSRKQRPSMGLAVESLLTAEDTSGRA